MVEDTLLQVKWKNLMSCMFSVISPASPTPYRETKIEGVECLHHPAGDMRVMQMNVFNFSPLLCALFA